MPRPKTQENGDLTKQKKTINPFLHISEFSVGFLNDIRRLFCVFNAKLPIYEGFMNFCLFVTAK